MNCSVRASGDRRPGYVGLPLPGVDVRIVDDDGSVVAEPDTIGEVEVRGPNVFLGYLNRPDATAAAMHDGWFRTGDLATRAADGYIRIVGRRSTDLIKTGGYRVGAGEIEGALLEHPAVAEAAAAGEPDDDLGERIVAWVVVAPGCPADREGADRPRGEPALRAQAPAQRPLPRRVAAQRDGQGAEDGAQSRWWRPTVGAGYIRPLLAGIDGRAAGADRRPQRVLADRQPVGRERQLERRRHAVRLRVDAGDRAAVHARHPDGAEACLDVVRAFAERDACLDLLRVGVEAPELVVPEMGDPDRVLGDGDPARAGPTSKVSASPLVETVVTVSSRWLGIHATPWPKATNRESIPIGALLATSPVVTSTRLTVSGCPSSAGGFTTHR